MTRFAIGVRMARMGIGVICGALLARSAAAQTDSAAARALFGEGRKLMEQEQFEQACPKFEESLRLDHGMGTQFNLAHCWDKLGRTASAWALFLDVAAAARAGNQPQREAAARERAKALEPKLTRLRVEVPDPATDAKVMRGDQEIGAAAWGTAMPVDPGTHVIRVTAPGKQPWSHEMEVPAEPRTFSVEVPALEDKPAPAEAAGPEMMTGEATLSADTGPEGSGAGPGAAPWILGGIGVAALVGGTIFAIQSRSDNSAALELCTISTPEGDRCTDAAEQRAHRDLVDDAKRGQLFGYVGFGLGGAALITATVLYMTADGEEAGSAGANARGGSSAGSIDLSPLIGLDTWGAVVNGRF